jgi:protein-S-isoprenylcysteine O-methyltransferase Ste14
MLETTNIILILLWVVFILYWILSSKKVKQTKYIKKTSLGGIIPRMILVLIIVLLFTTPFFSNHFIESNIYNQMFGLVICAFGIAFAIWARITLGENWSANPVELKKEHKLIITGPYKLVRHPIYSGVILGLLGTTIANLQLRILILFLLVTFGMILRSKMEEKLMSKQFGDDYLEYKKKSKFLIPKIF